MNDRPPGSFLAELERRKVVRAGVVYGAVAFAVVEAADFRRDPRFADRVEAVDLPEYWDRTSWPDSCSRTDEGAIRCN